LSRVICGPNSLKKENVIVYWKRLLINRLLELQQPQTEIQHGIDHMKQYYSMDSASLTQIRNFQEKYFQSEKEIGPICWFTSGNFLSKFLQRALQTKNMEQLFPLRFFIRDLYQHLQQVQTGGSDDSNLVVYRSVLPTQDYRHRVNESITMNSFFSTSMSRDLAVIFAEPSSILYEIHTGLKQNTDLVFANLSELNDDANSSSTIPLDQQEVLFALYTPFRISEVKMEEELSRVVLHLLDNDDLARISNEMEQQFKGTPCETEKLLERGKYWEGRGDIGKAVEYYKKLFTILLSNENERIETINDKLGQLYTEEQEGGMERRHCSLTYS
ncbi:unnamed protein product, partial [Didymodactylos carnosus]